MKPVRIQLSRKKGFDLQAASFDHNGLPAVNIARPGRWGNPYRIEVFGLALALELFARTVRGIWSPDGIPDNLIDAAYALHCAFRKRFDEHPMEAVRWQLCGSNLACWCDLPKPGEPDKCHGAPLLEIANA